MKNIPFKKLLISCTAEVRDELNPWIASNIANAGKDAISAPLSDDKGVVTHYRCFWRLEDPDKTILTEHIDTTYSQDQASWTWCLQGDVEGELIVKNLVKHLTI